MGPEDKAITSIDSDDLNDLIRQQAGDRPDPVESVVSDAEKGVKEPSRDKEPEIVVETEPVKDASRRESAPPAGDDQLTRALQTIERLETQVRDLQTRPAYDPRAPLTREPVIEAVEVLPGVRLPKDQRQWPIQLRADDVKNIGLDPEAAPGLNVLANAFLVYLDGLLNPMVRNIAAETASSRDTHNARVLAFFNAYPDLAGQDDFLDIVETRARNEERLHERYQGDDYAGEVAKRARTRIAALRGQTYDQYVSQVETAIRNTQGRGRAVSRASTASGTSGAGMRRPVPSNAQDKEMLDLL